MAINACRSRWIELLQLGQQIWQRLRFKLCAQGWLGRNGGDVEVVYYRLNIMGEPPTSKGWRPRARMASIVALACC